jgi:glutathione synthase/RimK-type ligase-like ATP-grasp enzyme
MQLYDVCLASDWSYDRDLLVRLEALLQLEGHTTYLTWPENLEETLHSLRAADLRFRYLVDRASNTSTEFLELYRFLAASGIHCFENPRILLRASDKAAMHLAFRGAGIPVPDTLILPPFEERREIQIDEQSLGRLGVPFVIKPANTTGGGTGVYQDGRGLEDVVRFRKEYPADKYLVQERILPRIRNGLRCWFRALYATGDVYCCWWNEQTHVYEILSTDAAGKEIVGRICDILHRIARITCLQLFSVEIVLDDRERLVVVDYVNESPDLRRKSQFVDGVPDELVDQIIERLAERIGQELEELETFRRLE